MKMYFTDAAVAALRPKKSQYLVWDAWTKPGQRGPDPARGLCVLVSPAGTKSFRVAFYLGTSSQPLYKGLGRVAEDILSVEEARKLARAARAMARRGEDPRAADPKASDNFAAALDRYIASEQIGRRGNVSADKTKGVILHNCKPWLTRPLGMIRRAEIDALLDSIRDGTDGKRGRPYNANRLYSNLRTFFAWAVRKHLIPASPMADIEQPFKNTKSRSREWFRKTAGDEAIKALWKAADELGGAEGKYLKMMILIGKRRAALAAMRWEQIDDSFWNAPKAQSKSKRLHAIPLPGLALRILHPRQSHGLVFDGLPERLETVQVRVRKLSGLDDFFFHGLRHLMETKLSELKVPPHIRDMLLDHATKRGSGAGYDHHEYVEEMREALETWAAHVEGLIAPVEGVQRLR